MMATESKQPLNQTITGVVPAANGTPAAGVKRKRPSSLLAVANQLPSVENSLEEFIAKANQTLVDVGNWGTDKVKEQEDEKRKEIDALRWKAAETQLRESELREGTLRRQLDNLQGKLAETEARAAVAAESGAAPAVIAQNDSMIQELRLKIAKAEEKAASADMRARTLSESLTAERSSRPAIAIDAGDTMSDERVRVAEAKAAKAMAAARAIQAGLNVSSTDLAAIESGLVVPEMQEKKTPWLAIAGAFVVGIAIMFVVTKVVMKSDPAPAAPAAAVVTPAPAAAAPAPAPAAVAPTPAPVAAAPAKPIVTPIEDPKPADEQPAAVAPASAAITPPPPAPIPTPAPAKVAPAPAPVHHAAAAPATHAPATHAAPAAKKTPAASNIADPFADPPAKKPAAPAKKPGAGAIADPF
jgi:hypothetical protein